MEKLDPKIEKLFISQNKEDVQIAIELLKARNYTDFESLNYWYRYKFQFYQLMEYFIYTFDDNRLYKTIGYNGQETTTGVKILNFK